VLGLEFALTAQTKKRGCPPDFADPVVREHSSCESDQHRSYEATATFIASPTPSTKGSQERDAGLLTEQHRIEARLRPSQSMRAH